MNKREFLKLGAAGLAYGLLPAAARAAEQAVQVRWLGGATLEIEAAGLRILTDPCLGEGAEAFVMGDPNEMFDLARGPNVKPHARLTPFPGLAHQRYDAVLLSHAHEDHFDQKAQAWLGPEVPLVAPAHDAEALSGKGFAAAALAHGAQRVFAGPDGRIRITAVPAVHSLDPRVSALLGHGNGYLIEAESSGRSQVIYWAGDTFLTAPVAAALDGLPAPDLFIPHIGAVGGQGALGQLSMNGRQAVEFAERTGARRVLPVHHSTYALYQEGPGAMAQAHIAAGAGWELLMPGEGGKIAL